MNSQVLIDREALKRIHRDLDACQKVIWLGMRGADPSYCSDAQARLKEIDELLAMPAPIPDADHSEDVRAMVVPDGYRLAPIEPTAAQCFTAAFNLCNEFGDEFVRDNKQFALAAYRSLVAASPSAKECE